MDGLRCERGIKGRGLAVGGHMKRGMGLGSYLSASQNTHTSVSK
jgi:hypothetical protein